MLRRRESVSDRFANRELAFAGNRQESTEFWRGGRIRRALLSGYLRALHVERRAGGGKRFHYIGLTQEVRQNNDFPCSIARINGQQRNASAI